jgi:hypothetical protein
MRSVNQKTFTEENRKAGNALAQKALALEKQFGQRARDGWMIARDSTLAGVDPSPGANNDHLGKNVANNVQRKAALARLQPEFAALPQEVRDYIHEVSKFYADQQDLKTKALIANILKGFEAGGLTQPLSVQAYAQLTTNTMEGKLTDADAAILDNETAFNALKNSSELRKVEGLYFPLMRHGKHVVRTTTALGELYGGVVGKPDANGDVEVRWEEGDTRKDVLAPYTKFAENTKAVVKSTTTERYIDGKLVSEEEARGRPHTVVQRARVQTRGLEAFDTAREAARFIRENRDNYEHIDEHSLPKEEDPKSGEVSHAQFSSIMSALNKREGLDPAFKSMLESNLREAVISRMAGNRIEQRSMPRRNVAGASIDMPRNMLEYSEASSRYLGKLRYTQEIHEALTHMRELTKLSDKDSQVRSQVLQELTKRFGENVADINEPPRALRLLMTATMMARLASPMYHVVNGTQPGMVTLPVLAGHYGMLRSAAALMRSYSSVGAGKLLWSGVTDTATAIRHIREVGLDTSDLMGSLRAKLAKEPDGAGLVRMFDELAGAQLNPEKGFELASAVTRGGKTADVALAKVERITRQMGYAVEALNRATTAVTAYRLGRSIAGMTEEQAIAHAKDMVDQTQFNYTPTTSHGS